LTIIVVFWGPYRKRKKIETGSVAIGANSSLMKEGRKADDWALETLVKSASKPDKKITTASRLLCVHSLPIKCLWAECGASCLEMWLYVQ
jgi:hypothetical protein